MGFVSPFPFVVVHGSFFFFSLFFHSLFQLNLNVVDLGVGFHIKEREPTDCQNHSPSRVYFYVKRNELIHLHYKSTEHFFYRSGMR